MNFSINKMLSLAAVSGALFLSSTAFATSTIDCRSNEIYPDGTVAFLTYNVGTIGLPTSFFGGLTLSDETVSSDGPSELDPTVYSISGFFSDETETNMAVVDDVGVQVLLLKTIKSGEVEAGILTFGGRSFEVICRQIG